MVRKAPGGVNGVMTTSKWVLGSSMRTLLPDDTRRRIPPPLLPPGPEDGRLAGTVAFHRDPLAVLRRGQKRFWGIFTKWLSSTRAGGLGVGGAGWGGVCAAGP